jgi:hypothetical protein
MVGSLPLLRVCRKRPRRSAAKIEQTNFEAKGMRC